ncbi:hypothetical protein BG011_008600 [Mortierella polycephala]|uniref:Uncharacterized protein n=1 Tax=Mortierella polycephala TaxID=41804 RepID=A0A9P6PMP8_9FUNG|nr:hypothetical protein BG011_008600 [Mortierella polycephala]
MTIIKPNSGFYRNTTAPHTHRQGGAVETTRRFRPSSTPTGILSPRRFRLQSLQPQPPPQPRRDQSNRDHSPPRFILEPTSRSRTRPSSMPSSSSRPQSQMLPPMHLPQRQMLLSSSSSSSSSSMPTHELQILHRRLLDLQSLQQYHEMQQDRLRRAFSEPDVRRWADTAHRHSIEDHPDYDTQRQQQVDNTRSMTQIREDPFVLDIEAIDNRIDTVINTIGMEHTDDDGDYMSLTTVEHSRHLEMAQREREEAAKLYDEAARRLRQAQEHEQAILFQREMQALNNQSKDSVTTSDGQVLFIHKETQAVLANTESCLEDPQEHPQHQQQHQQDQQQEEQQQQEHQQQQPNLVSPPVQVRHFLPDPGDRSSPRTATTLDGRGSDSSNNTTSPREIPHGNRTDETHGPFRRYPASPRVKVKTEEADENSRNMTDDLGKDIDKEERPFYEEYDVHVEVPSSMGSEAGDRDGRDEERINQDVSSQSRVRSASQRWRAPTPLPVKPKLPRSESPSKPLLPLTATSATSATDRYSDTRPNPVQSRSQAARSFIPRPRPYSQTRSQFHARLSALYRSRPILPTSSSRPQASRTRPPGSPHLPTDCNMHIDHVENMYYTPQDQLSSQWHIDRVENFYYYPHTQHSSPMSQRPRRSGSVVSSPAMSEMAHAVSNTTEEDSEMSSMDHPRKESPTL